MGSDLFRRPFRFSSKAPSSESKDSLLDGKAPSSKSFDSSFFDEKAPSSESLPVEKESYRVEKNPHLKILGGGAVITGLTGAAVGLTRLGDHNNTQQNITQQNITQQNYSQQNNTRRAVEGRVIAELVKRTLGDHVPCVTFRFTTPAPPFFFFFFGEPLISPHIHSQEMIATLSKRDVA